MTKYKITMDRLLECLKATKTTNENALKYNFLDNDEIHELFGEIRICDKLIEFIESKKITPKLEKMFYCTINYSCVDCPNYNKTCGGRK